MKRIIFFLFFVITLSVTGQNNDRVIDSLKAELSKKATVFPKWTFLTNYQLRIDMQILMIN